MQCRAIGSCSVLSRNLQPPLIEPQNDNPISMEGIIEEDIGDHPPVINENLLIDTNYGINLRSRRIEQTAQNVKWYNIVELFEVAKIADRYGLSDRAAAAISTAALIDFVIITANDKNFVIDRNKIHRSRLKLRTTQLEKLNFDDIEGLCMDGRKDITKVYKDNAIKKIKEEHISFVQQPNSLFIGHKTVKSNAADDIVASIEEILDEKSIPNGKITSIGSDGTNSNTGEDGGAIQKLELK